MKLIYLILITSLLPALTYAQSNYREGYVVKSDGDTLKGYINVHEWDNNPLQVEFKSLKSENTVTTFTPATIKSFSVSNNYKFVSYTGALSNNRNIAPDIDTGLDTTTSTATVFLRELVSGPHVKLLLLHDKTKNRYFYQEEDVKPVELIYYNYYVEGTNLMKKRTIYLSQSAQLYQKYNNGKTADAKFDFYNTDIIRYFEKINQIKPGKKSATGNSRFFIGAGAGSIKTQFLGKNRFSGEGPVTNITPIVNIGFDFFNNPIVQRFVLRAELSLWYNKAELPGQPESYTGPLVKQFYRIKQYNATVAPQLIYNIYSAQKFKWFISGGIGFNISNYTQNENVYIPDDQYLTKYTYDLRKLWISFPLKTGVLLNNRFEAALGYAPSAAINDAVEETNINVGIKYLFGKTGR